MTTVPRQQQIPTAPLIFVPIAAFGIIIGILARAPPIVSSFFYPVYWLSVDIIMAVERAERSVQTGFSKIRP